MIMDKNIVLLLLIDGLRHDYLNPLDSPFLYSLGELNIAGIVRETFAFELRPAFFAGLQPEDCDIAHMFYYNPVDSPFRSIDITHKDRSIISRAVRAEAERRGYNLVKHIGTPAEIPLELLKYFDFSEKYHTTDPSGIIGHKTLFDYLRNDGKRWLWIAYPEGPGTTKGVLEQFLSSLNPDLDFIYLHFSELDWVGHEFGPFSKEQKATLREIDQAVMELFKKVNQSFSQVRSIIFGDHGQVEIRKYIDIEAMLKETGLEIEKDYICFLDSTQARFWFLSEVAKRRVKELLASVSEGRILTNDDYKRLHFSFKHNKFGDLIFVVNDGIGIFPNYFQRSKPCKGLHGYLPDVTGNWANLIITGCGISKSIDYPITLVDIFPTLLELLDYQRPVSIQAKSIFERFDLKISQYKYKASIVIPTYNRIDILKKTIAAIEDQTYPKEDFELIVVNDGSSDSSQYFLEKYNKITKLNFKCFNISNSGPAAARNVGIRNALGGIIILLGDDILTSPNFIENHLVFHSEWPQFSNTCLGSTEWAKNIDMNTFLELITSKEGGQQFNYDLILKQDQENIGYCFFWSSNISFKRLFCLTHGLFNENIFKHAMWEDIELGYRLEKIGLTLHFRENCKGYHDHQVDFEGFAERQRMVGWYSHDLFRSGIPIGYSCRGYEKDRLHSKKALYDIINAVKTFERNCQESDFSILKRVYNHSLYYAAMVGYKERDNDLKEVADGIIALMYNLSLADEQIREKDQLLTECNSKIQSFLNSWSWKITSPLRWILRMAKGK